MIRIFAAFRKKMGPKKGRRVRKIGLPTDTPSKFELGDTAADKQGGREGGKRKGERGIETGSQGGRKPGGGKLHIHQRREWLKSVQGYISIALMTKKGAHLPDGLR